MKRFLVTTVISSIAPIMLHAGDSPEHDKRIVESANVLSEILSAKDQSIPSDLLQKAECVGVIPNLKRVGLIIGAKYGKGVITCRVSSGWSAPSTGRIEGGTIGLQIDASEPDVVFVVMNHHVIHQLM